MSKSITRIAGLVLTLVLGGGGVALADHDASYRTDRTSYDSINALRARLEQAERRAVEAERRAQEQAARAQRAEERLARGGWNEHHLNEKNARIAQLERELAEVRGRVVAAETRARAAERALQLARNDRRPPARGRRNAYGQYSTEIHLSH